MKQSGISDHSPGITYRYSRLVKSPNPSGRVPQSEFPQRSLSHHQINQSISLRKNYHLYLDRVLYIVYMGQSELYF